MEDEIPTDEAVIASWQQTADYWAARAKRAEAEVERLRIATSALEYIVQIADRGADVSAIGVYAHDALIRISVVE